MLQGGEGGVLGRRLSTLLCAGWVPHDSVFVAEVPLSLFGHRLVPAQAFSEGFPDRDRAFSFPANLVDSFGLFSLGPAAYEFRVTGPGRLASGPMPR